ncbi:hypothetical protein, partial [Tolypothrix sp. PCC 7601]|uniref:hypothetical protein n=1 Tax=Tolypothrix sp. PCC 7601 TaxID=1188 RepID=UPI001AEF8F40
MTGESVRRSRSRRVGEQGAQAVSPNASAKRHMGHWCQLNVKPSWLQGFALTPSPSPTRRGEQEIQFPFSLREKG